MKRRNLFGHGKLVVIISICLFLIALLPSKNFAQSGGKWATGGNSINSTEFFGTLNNTPIVFKTLNTERMRLLSNGYLGIGVTDPEAMLHVDGTIRFNSLNGTANGLVVANKFGTLQRISFTGNNRHVLLGNGTFGTYADDDWTIDGNNIYTQLSGNVGIGTQTPEFKLDVNGDAKIRGELLVGNSIKFNGITDQITTTTGSLDFGTTNLITGGTIQTNSITTSGGVLDLENTKISGILSVGNNIKINGITNEITAENGKLNFGNSNLFTEGFIQTDEIIPLSGTLNLGNANITTTGSISANNLIFTDTPNFENLTINGLTTTNTLDVNENINVSNMLNFTGPTPSIYTQIGDLNIGSSQDIMLSTSGRVTIPEGKLGIGVFNPIEALDVDGNANIRGTLYVQNGVIIGQRMESDVIDVIEVIRAPRLEIGERIDVISEINVPLAHMQNLSIDGQNSKITSTSGSINFDNENLNTTGAVNAASLQANSLTVIGNSTLGGSLTTGIIEALDVNAANIRSSMGIQTDGTVVSNAVESQTINASEILASSFINSNTVVAGYLEANEVKINNLADGSTTRMVVADADGNLSTNEILINTDTDGNLNLGNGGTTTFNGDINTNTVNTSVINATDATQPSTFNNLTVTKSLKVGENSVHITSVNIPDGSDNRIYSSNGNLKIQSEGENFNTILNSGNNGVVGIGTNNPGFGYNYDNGGTLGFCKLDVAGHGRFGSDQNNFTRIGYNGANAIIDAWDNHLADGSQLLINYYSGANTVIGGSTGNFITNNNSYLAITANKSVGIGTQTPGAKLHVAGDVKIDIINPSTNSSDQMVVVGNDGILKKQAVPSLCNTITCDVNGNVGIGTSNIQSKLSVDGNASFVSTSNYNNSFQIGNTIPIRRGISLDDDASGKVNFWIHNWQSDAAFNFMKNNNGTGSSTTSLMTISKSGNVGIGTTIPLADLHILGSDAKIRLQNIAGANDPSFSNWDIENSGSYLNFKFNDQTFMNISPGEIMSSGIVNPNPILHVYGTISSDYQNNLYWTENHWTTALMSPNGSAWRTKNKSATLNRYLGFGMTDGGWYWISSTNDDDQGVSNYHMKLNVLNDAEHTAILAVEGKIWAKEVKVKSTNPYADYVFKPDYELKTLSEVENYINEHKHLPDVPSEKEIDDAGGINLGDMDVILLKKIEELTLYTIQQQKLLEKQQQQIISLTNEVEKLKK